MTTPPLAQLRAQPPPPLSTWSKAWRYLIAVAVGAFVWLAYAAVLLRSEPTPRTHGGRIGAVLLLDLLLGAAAVALLALRRRYPLAVACTVAAASTASVASLGALIVAVVSMATWRRRRWVALSGAVCAGAAILSQGLYRPWFVPAGSSSARGGAGAVVANVVLVLVIFGAAVAAGFYIATRRELFASLRERAVTLEREQLLLANAAREAERTRIAREMHDELAHRISLVALHAGALAYREDLSRAETAATAQTIQTGAQQALTELRQVLGVLRGSGTARPQPGLAEFPALLADVREAGAEIRLDVSGLPEGALPEPSAMPETLSYTAFRILQEALTNARKHAPGEPVDVRLDGSPGTQLGIEVRNRVALLPGPALPSAGVGLAGLGERAALAGGSLEYGVGQDGVFVIRARLPWLA